MSAIELLLLAIVALGLMAIFRRASAAQVAWLLVGAGSVGLLVLGMYFWRLETAEEVRRQAIVAEIDKMAAETIHRDALAHAEIVLDEHSASHEHDAAASDAHAASTSIEDDEAAAIAAEPPAEQAERPAWLDEPDGVYGNQYRAVLTVGPFATRGECVKQRDAVILEALGDYTRRNLGAAQAELVGIPESFIEQVTGEQYFETIEMSFGPMVQLHVQLLIGEGTRNELADLGHRALVNQRMLYLGGALGAVLLLLGGTFGYLKATVPAN